MSIIKAIQQYDKAVWNLAKTMFAIREKHSRKSLLAITPFNKTKIGLFLKLGELQQLNLPNLVPEHYMEVMDETKDNQYKYLKQASEQGLKPLDLRKIIRQEKKTVSSNDKNVKVNNWQRHVILLENELKNMPPDVKARALSSIANSILK